jgi:GNAT superfamily N-acetyltransferase
MTAILMPRHDPEPRVAPARRLFVTLPTRVRLRDGRVVTVRGASPEDGPEICAMHARCSEATTAARYQTPMRRLPRRLLAGLLAAEVALVVLDDLGRVVALGTLERTEPDDRRRVELGVLVEDAWQGAGLGTVLVRQLAAAGRLLGHHEVVAVTREAWGRRALGRLGTAEAVRTPFGETKIRLRLRPDHVAGLPRPDAVVEVPRPIPARRRRPAQPVPAGRRQPALAVAANA